MSLSWTYLTRRFAGMNYRDFVAVSMIGSFMTSQYLSYHAKQDDNTFIMQRVYTTDQSSMAFRDSINQTDAAVKRDHAMRYATQVKQLRAEKEREMALDAFNYLNKKELSL
jgi:hypothetical protein